VCNFCNFWINFIIRRDKNNVYRFAALQTEPGQELLKKFSLKTTDFDTFVLIDGDTSYTKSTAALKITKNLRSVIKLLYPFIFLPQPIRDFLYNLVAGNRYIFFGKRAVCRIPTEEEKSRFL
jgi:predicted DCC family thiol-disulfide oxidoreductase YuxK